MKNYQENSGKVSTSPIQCANCWGHQEYADSKIEKAVIDKMPAFIMKWVRRYF